MLSIGHSLEIVKDLGDAETVSEQYTLDAFQGTHAIGHVRMATESDVDIAGAHPYWAYPFADVAVVHNGQLTNYFYWRRRLERSGHRFQSECDSEIIAVYLAEKMQEGASLEDSMRQSLEELDGVFTYMCVTKDALGVCKDEMAAKPLVLYEGDDMVVLASEEMAIRAIIDHEIETVRPLRGRGAGMDALTGEARITLRRARARRARRDGARRLRDRRRHGRRSTPKDLSTRQDQPRPARPDLRARASRDVTVQNPGAKHSLGVGDPDPLQDPLRGQPRLLRLRPDRRARRSRSRAASAGRRART